MPTTTTKEYPYRRPYKSRRRRDAAKLDGNKKDGKVNVTFRENNDDTVSLEISDDGPGFPVEFNIQKSRSLGMNLIKGLSGQLDGAFSIRRTNGITFLLIAFTPKHTVGRDKYYL